ncbi:S-layer homology domain-containing protein [Desulfofundulus salinus]|nr:S-layer homology domain-containing protein [Desulfofundulus salinum]
MVKQKLMMVLAVLLLVLVTAAPAFAGGLFPDLDGHWAADQSYLMYDLGVFGGYPDGTFKPNNNITWAEFIAIVVRAFDLPSAPANTVLPYEDVKSGDWFYDPVARAYAAGILKGYGSKLEPNKAITRGEIARIVVLNIGENGAPLNKVAQNFSDVPSGHLLAEYVSKASVLGIIGGYPDGTFGPSKTATRAEAAVMVNRAMEAEAAEKVLPAEETLKAAIEGYADRWAYVQFTFARDKINDYLKDYALPSVIKWYRDTMQPDEPIPGVYGRLEPGTLQIKVLNRSRTLAKVEAHYEVGVRIRRASDGAEAEVMAIKVDEVLLMKLSGGKWKVGVVYDQKATKIR